MFFCLGGGANFCQPEIALVTSQNKGVAISELSSVLFYSILQNFNLVAKKENFNLICFPVLFEEKKSTVLKTIKETKTTLLIKTLHRRLTAQVRMGLTPAPRRTMS